MIRRVPATLRWSACFVAALGIHAGGAAVLLAHWQSESDQVANAPVIMIDLAPVPVAPETTPTDVPPDTMASQLKVGVEKAPEKPEETLEKVEPEPEPEKPEQVVATEPEKPDEVKPEPDKPSEIAMLPPPRPIEKIEEKPDEKKKEVNKKRKPQPPKAQFAAAPSAADRRDDRAAAPAPGANSDSNAIPNWRSRLISQIERYKRYPSDAQSRGDRGVVRLAFSVDRSGGVHNARVVATSGSNVLDRETLAMIERASPLPPPPNEMPGAYVTVVVPINYNLR